MIHVFDLSYFIERQISKAVKDVAESFGGDVKQTESELLMKLLKTSQDEKSSATNLAYVLFTWHLPMCCYFFPILSDTSLFPNKSVFTLLLLFKCVRAETEAC